MAALTANRSTIKQGNYYEPESLFYSVGAAFHIYQGAIVCLNPATGFVQPGSTALGLVAVGVAGAEYDNSGTGSIIGAGNGAAGNIVAQQIRTGAFKFNSGTGADVITGVNVGQACFIQDDNTVCLTDGGGTRSFAGPIVSVDTDGGVYVELGIAAQSKGGIKQQISWSQSLASVVATGDIVVPGGSGFAGRLSSFSATVTTPAVTAAKAATFTPKVTATPVTGGAVALTSANCTPIGAVVAGTAITAGANFLSSDTLKVTVSGLTAFVEGVVQFVLTFNP